MNQPIVFISGSKGGVGKSLTAMAVLDYLTTEHRYVRLLEADTTNPDVWKAYRRTVEGEVASLDEVEGWINLVNTCDANPFKAVVVNTPARNNDAVREHAAILLESLKELARPLITLWVINRQRDSLELLHNYMESVNTGVVHVIRNGYFGDQSKFELYPRPRRSRHRRTLLPPHHPRRSRAATQARRPRRTPALAQPRPRNDGPGRHLKSPGGGT